jgi:cytochrome c oxidase cbb3-type subunit 3
VVNESASQKQGPELHGIDPRASGVVLVGLLLLLVAGGLFFYLLKNKPSPPPAEVAADPRLVEGRELYLSRCVSCHGPLGKGDGPIASGLKGPPPGDLTDQIWKHGERPEDVLKVIAQGIPDTSMSGWAGTYPEPQLRALAAYVFYLAGRPVPEALGEPRRGQ